MNSSEDEAEFDPNNENIAEPEDEFQDLDIWQEHTDSMSDIPFTKQNKLLVEPPENGEPYDYFRMLLDVDFLNQIVMETNRYAEEVFLSSSALDRSRISEWKELTVPELLCFIGVTLHMGTIKINRVQDYWKKHRLFNLTCFSRHMSRDRYLIIMRCLHFSKNPEIGDPRPDDRLHKIRPVLDFFNNKMEQIYYPGKNLSLDESMILWKGRLVFRQYIKNKRHKYGIKLYMLTEPDGLILRFLIYTGQLDIIGGKGHAQKVVLELMRGKLCQGHSVYMDNFYNSFDLAKNLLDQKTYCTGTLRADRKGAPNDVVRAKLKKGTQVYIILDIIILGHLFSFF